MAPRDGTRVTRREFLSAAITGAVFPPEWRRYADPATELEVFRLTDPAHSCYLPAYYQRVLARRGGFLLYWSDRSGSPQAFRMDLKSGESRQLTQAEALDGATLTLMPDERSFCYFDGPVLHQVNLANGRQREVYRIPQGWRRCQGASVAADGLRAFFSEAQDGGSRLRSVALLRGVAATVAEAPWEMLHPVGNPKRAQILYRQANEALWIVNFDGKQNRKARLAEGEIGPAMWAPDGQTVLYLNFPTDTRQLRTIREFTPDRNADKAVSQTSQFGHFGCNQNTSVFVGASQNRGSPYILILLRVTRRELTLCEHRASEVDAVAPRFSPDAQNIFFQSDRDGKPAIYRVRVDKFVEKIEDEES